jgi:hypothetical protein
MPPDFRLTLALPPEVEDPASLADQLNKILATVKEGFRVQ